jgi:starch-binding outer membrane protein, SusD/RagB family
MKTFISDISFRRIAILSAILSIGLLSGCNKDFLDKQPLDQLSTASFWKTESDALLGLTGVYYLEGQESFTAAKQQRDFWNQDNALRLFEATTDNGFEKDNEVTDINSGNLISTYNPVNDLWKTSYVKIAKCNNFLGNIGTVTMDETRRAQMIAEIRTIRAFDYFYMAFLWGDVPLVTKIQSVQEANTVTRNPRADVITFAINELLAAIADLPVTRPDAEKGRITKGGALGILGRVYLEEKRWTEAAAVYKQIIDLGIYIIDPSFSNLFIITGENSKEIILSSKRMPAVYGNSILLSCLGFTWGGYHHYSPFNGELQDFECTDGKPITESPLYNIDNPYVNRDPRLLKTFFINNVTVFKGSKYISSPDSSASKYPDQLTRRPWSGYALLKFCDPNYSGDVREYGCDFPMIRYAEVLLSYLEANLESGTTITKALLDQTINKVRGRADVNMPAVIETDPTKLRVILRRERRNELAWEGLRLFDLNRWHISHIVMSAKMYGMKLCTSAQAATYTKFPVDAQGYYYVKTKAFREAIDYLWPIPQRERDVNSNLTQNTGY